MRDVLLVERVLLTLQAATAQGVTQGGGQCAERACHEEQRQPPGGVATSTVSRVAHATIVNLQMGDNAVS